jgi:hypothetical protein
MNKSDATSFFICKIVVSSIEFLTKNLRKNVVFKTGKKILVYIVSGVDVEQLKRLHTISAGSPE